MGEEEKDDVFNGDPLPFSSDHTPNYLKYNKNNSVVSPLSSPVATQQQQTKRRNMWAQNLQTSVHTLLFSNNNNKKDDNDDEDGDGDGDNDSVVSGASSITNSLHSLTVSP